MRDWLEVWYGWIKKKTEQANLGRDGDVWAVQADMNSKKIMGDQKNEMIMACVLVKLMNLC